MKYFSVLTPNLKRTYLLQLFVFQVLPLSFDVQAHANRHPVAFFRLFNTNMFKAFIRHKFITNSVKKSTNPFSHLCTQWNSSLCFYFFSLFPAHLWYTYIIIEHWSIYIAINSHKENKRKFSYLMQVQALRFKIICTQ